MTAHDEPWSEPPLAGDEAAAIIGAVERQRATLAWKCGGLDEEGMRATTVTSTITLGALLKHLALVEDNTFTRRIGGLDIGAPWNEVDWDANPDWEWRSAAEDSPEELMTRWRDAVARSRIALDGNSPNLRRVLFDTLEEYARHVGHADIIRESIDGLVGEDRPT